MAMNKSIGDIFWENAERYRKLKNIFQKDLEVALGMNKGRYVNLKHARNFPTPKEMDKLIEFYEIQAVDLFDDWTDEEWEKFTKESGVDGA